MTRNLFFAGAVAAIIFTGCTTVPPNAERGPHNTIAYDVAIDATPPGAQIEANGQVVGTTPLHLKIFGDTDGTFHDFGSEFYIIRALPIATNQFPQTRYFGTGHMLGPEDHIPRELHFDMTRPQPEYAPGTYPYSYYGPPPPYYYGPGVQFYFGGPRYHRWRRY